MLLKTLLNTLLQTRIKTRNLLSLLVRLLRDSLAAVPLSRDMAVDEPCLKPDLSLMNVYLLAMSCQTLQ